MIDINEEIMKCHIKTHTEHSAEDDAAVTMLKSFLLSGGRINTKFDYNDKWPNTDGTFELVPNPTVSRRPEQSFFVQIKGIHSQDDNDSGFKYSLKNLAFPAFIGSDCTLDPGILFVVVNPDIRGSEKVFWKYMSVDFINSIDFNKKSTTISFSRDDEIINTDEGVMNFCKKLEKIIEHHLFINRLSKNKFTIEDVKKIVDQCNTEIVESIDRFEILNDTRDNVSRRILARLNDLCTATLLLNCFYEGFKLVDLQLAWERAILNVNTKYLSSFLKELKYLDGRIPDEGQSERLLLRYYNFMWQIRKNLFEQFKLTILPNLEKFPLKIDEVDKDYYELIANAIENTNLSKRELRKSRFYVHKKTPFFVGTERYYEITLQLAGAYATKYNRITAYTKENIATSYSIQVGFADFSINLWGVESKLKVITNWQVSVDPVCLNTLSKIVRLSTRLSSLQTEYISLMKFLTKTGLSLLEFIDLPDSIFYSQIELIYEKKNKESFMNTIVKIKKNYSESENNFGRNTVRYLLLNLREEILEDVLPYSLASKKLCDELYLSRRCYPFEKSPFLSDLVGSKTSESHNIRNIMDITGNYEMDSIYPYLAIKHQIRRTGEIFFKEESFGEDFEVKLFNRSLDAWERQQGYEIKEYDGFLTIGSYENETLYILERLLNMSKTGNKGQKEFNNKYLRESKDDFRDPLKKQAIAEVFVNSRALLIYGAAGTGKTTLINYISNMMSSQKKLFLTKTHTAKQNLMRRIENPGTGSDFISLNSFTKKVELPEYDIIFVDECSIIDNRTMATFLSKIRENTFVVLAGDIHQIESIDFGNWFLYAKDIVSTQGSNVELKNTWRTKDQNLISLWDEVRNRGVLMTVKLVIDGPFSKDIGEDIFSQRENDEVILCLNYDGKFGLNNMNSYFQNANKQGAPVVWNEWTYKAGDPILFNESKRFSILYNNLKGKIVAIKKEEECIYFTIDVFTILTESSCVKEDITFVSVDEETTRIIICIDAYKETDNEQDRKENKLRSVIPFQLAYAVSIHKAQGLEYDSVKVIIPSVNAEKITHGIFYTAITRAKKKLKIYWSTETMTEIINGFQKEGERTKSFDLVKQKLGLI